MSLQVMSPVLTVTNIVITSKVIISIVVVSDEQPSLLRTFVNYRIKKFYNIGSRKKAKGWSSSPVVMFMPKKELMQADTDTPRPHISM
jgi:hypothetical protein